MIFSKHSSIKQKLIGLLFLFSGALILQFTALYVAFSQVTINSERYDKIIYDKDIIADILPPPLFLIETHALVFEVTQTTNLTRKNAILEQLHILKSQFTERHEYWQNISIDKTIKDQLILKADVTALNYFSLLETSILPLILKNKYSDAQSLINEKLTPLFYIHKAEVEKLVTLSVDHQKIIENESKKSIQFAFLFSVVISGCILLLCLYNGIKLLKQILAPLAQVQALSKSIEEGDLTQSIEIKNHDELSEVAKSVNTSSSKIKVMITEISDSATNINMSSQEVMSSAHQINQGSEQVKDFAESVANQTQALSQNAAKISQQVSEVNHSTSGVAAAIEEMSATIAEVSRRCITSAEISGVASLKTKQTKESVHALDMASKEISRVVEVINDIAEQTNLLALNAMIEAASAGDAGRGFAVVASEVKELAYQSARATDEIAEQIKTMQTNSSKTVIAIAEIASIAADVNEIANAIAVAMEEQTSTTQEIARNVNQVSNSTSQAYTQIEILTTGIDNVGLEMAQMKSIADNASYASHTSKENSKTLEQLALRLQRAVSQFKI